ncbi:MAG TPA: ABC transporter permease [Gemmatimonadaceae bacterium]|nr:ABC transporter permease [Gemmatimonadaceae bacterium]
MREALALVRASWLTASSYRLGMMMSLGGLIVTILPMYFVAGALQPVLAERISTEGGNYFGFLVVGVLAFSFLSTAVNAVSGAIASGISTGTLEAMLSTCARLRALIAGLVGYAFTWTAVRGALTIVMAVLLGVRLSAAHSGIALLILALIVMAYFGIGLMAAAMVLAFRTTGPLPQVVLLLSGLLGGVYYPTSVIPSWIQSLSSVVPLTYGLRALRRVWLDGLALREVIPDVVTLAGMAIGLLTLGVAVFATGMRYARRAGTLAQY